jgi:hypothetical protein
MLPSGSTSERKSQIHPSLDANRQPEGGGAGNQIILLCWAACFVSFFAALRVPDVEALEVEPHAAYLGAETFHQQLKVRDDLLAGVTELSTSSLAINVMDAFVRKCSIVELGFDQEPQTRVFHWKGLGGSIR